MCLLTCIEVVNSMHGASRTAKISVNGYHAVHQRTIIISKMQDYGSQCMYLKSADWLLNDSRVTIYMKLAYIPRTVIKDNPIINHSQTRLMVILEQQ